MYTRKRLWVQFWNRFLIHNIWTSSDRFCCAQIISLSKSGCAWTITIVLKREQTRINLFIKVFLKIPSGHEWQAHSVWPNSISGSSAHILLSGETSCVSTMAWRPQSAIVCRHTASLPPSGSRPRVCRSRRPSAGLSGTNVLTWNV